MGKIILPQTYWGIRFTADAADCALPISIDSRSGCTFNCLYCFSNSLMRDCDRNLKKKTQLEKLGATQTEFSLEKLIKLIENKYERPLYRLMSNLINKGLVVQLGALGDPFDHFEIKTRWTYRFLEYCIKNNIPVRISTKGVLLKRKEYLDLLKGAKNIMVAFSIITPDEDTASKIEIGVPTPQERFECMQALSEIGIKTSLRYRPIIPPLAEREYKGKPQYQVMIDLAKKAGSNIISFETIFLSQNATPKQVNYYKKICEAIGDLYFVAKFKYYSIRKQTCLRQNRLVKYKLIMNIRNYAKNNGFTVGISEPHFKEYGDYGSCCGISRKDPIFGNYGTSLTDIVILGRKHYQKTGENMLFKFDDWIPEWAKYVKRVEMANNGDKINKMREKEHTWHDFLNKLWNNPSHRRSPFNYFEGILQPVDYDEKGNVIYKYVNWVGQIYDPESLPKLDVKLDSKLQEKDCESEVSLGDIRNIARGLA